MSFQTSIPTLSEGQLEQLDQWLEERVVPQDGMSLEMLDGFLSALIVGPEPVLPSEYLPLIWPEDMQWASDDEQARMTGLVLAFSNDIVGRLALDLEELDDEGFAEAMPLLAFPEQDEAEAPVGDGADETFTAPEDFPLAAAWALGFLRGVGLRQQAWERWAAEHEFVDDDLSMVETLALFAPEQAEELGLDPADIPAFADRLDMVTDLPAMLQDLNTLRLTPKTVRGGQLPGRNEPCPCGSGRKFKQCCGAPGSVH